MAKAKTTTKAAPKKAAKAPAKTKKATAPKTAKVDQACEDALKKLQSLGIEPQLQSEMEWCLGSYRHDNNPSGLYQMVERALEVLRAEVAKKTKGVTAKFIADLESALKK